MQSWCFRIAFLHWPSRRSSPTGSWYPTQRRWKLGIVTVNFGEIVRHARFHRWLRGRLALITAGNFRHQCVHRDTNTTTHRTNTTTHCTNTPIHCQTFFYQSHQSINNDVIQGGMSSWNRQGTHLQQQSLLKTRISMTYCTQVTLSHLVITHYFETRNYRRRHQQKCAVLFRQNSGRKKLCCWVCQCVKGGARSRKVPLRTPVKTKTNRTHIGYQPKGHSCN